MLAKMMGLQRTLLHTHNDAHVVYETLRTHKGILQPMTNKRALRIAVCEALFDGHAKKKNERSR